MTDRHTDPLSLYVALAALILTLLFGVVQSVLSAISLGVQIGQLSSAAQSGHVCEMTRRRSIDPRS